jgi:Flp pilus assembly pilin Flp
MLKTVKGFLGRLHRDEQGAMAVEKILLLALIALPIIIVLFAFRKTIVQWFQAQQDQLSN